MIRKKYELVASDKINYFRIKALISFADVEIGDIGGYVKSEANLSQEGDCWIYDDSIVADKARVRGNAKVKYSSLIKDQAVVFEQALVVNSCISDSAAVTRSATVVSSTLNDDCRVSGSSFVFESQINDDVIIQDNARVFNSMLYHNTWVFNNAFVSNIVINSIDVSIGNYRAFTPDTKYCILDFNDFKATVYFDKDQNRFIVAFNKQTLPLSEFASMFLTFSGYTDLLPKLLSILQQEQVDISQVEDFDDLSCNDYGPML